MKLELKTVDHMQTGDFTLISAYHELFTKLPRIILEWLIYSNVDYLEDTNIHQKNMISNNSWTTDCCKLVSETPHLSYPPIKTITGHSNGLLSAIMMLI